MPLRQGQDKLAIGVVARMHPQGKLLLAYFWGRKSVSFPALNETETLTYRNSVCALRISDMHLLSGEWGILGISKKWSAADWPMPIFVTTDLLTHKILKVQYSNSDPSILVDRTVIPSAELGYQPDGLFGPQAVEKYLSKIILEK